MKFELSHDRRNISDEDLLSDMRHVAEALPDTKFTQAVYRQHGKYGVRTIIRRFGTWNAGVKATGLKVIRKQNIPEKELLDAIGELWIRLGRQPKYTELVKPAFPYSAKPYEQRYGSWRKALEAFVSYANAEEFRAPQSVTAQASSRRTSRSINLRLRWQVLERDHFRCRACGASPAITPGVQFEIDHIVPWSMGGETTLGNLQALCRACNQGKSNSTHKTG